MRATASLLSIYMPVKGVLAEHRGMKMNGHQTHNIVRDDPRVWRGVQMPALDEKQ